MGSLFYLAFIVKMISEEGDSEAVSALSMFRSLVGEETFSRFEKAYSDVISREIHASLNSDFSEGVFASLASNWLDRLRRVSEPTASLIRSSGEAEAAAFIYEYLSLAERMSGVVAKIFKNRKERIGEIVARGAVAVSRTAMWKAELLAEEEDSATHLIEYVSTLEGILSFAIASIAYVLTGRCHTYREENLETLIWLSEDLLKDLESLMTTGKPRSSGWR